VTPAPGRERYLLPWEAAGILGVSRPTVTRWIRQGRLPVVRTLGGHTRLPESRIRALADQLRHQPPTPPWRRHRP
jgi:excisionase family DNA binding protein